MGSRWKGTFLRGPFIGPIMRYPMSKCSDDIFRRSRAYNSPGPPFVRDNWKDARLIATIEPRFLPAFRPFFFSVPSGGLEGGPQHNGELYNALDNEALTPRNDLSIREISLHRARLMSPPPPPSLTPAAIIPLVRERRKYRVRALNCANKMCLSRPSVHFYEGSESFNKTINFRGYDTADRRRNDCCLIR